MDITHSNDAGRYGGSKPSDMVSEFMSLAQQLRPVDELKTTLGNIVQLVYMPANMELNNRNQLLNALQVFVLNGGESWHGDWFLWNVVTVTDQDLGEIRMVIS
jgi:hypothetical protein